jgi:hypothetical protein
VSYVVVTKAKWGPADLFAARATIKQDLTCRTFAVKFAIASYLVSEREEALYEP